MSVVSGEFTDRDAEFLGAEASLESRASDERMSQAGGGSREKERHAVYRGERGHLNELRKVDLRIAKQAPGESEEKMLAKELAGHEGEGGEKQRPRAESQAGVGLQGAKSRDEETEGEGEGKG